MLLCDFIFTGRVFSILSFFMGIFVVVVLFVYSSFFVGVLVLYLHNGNIYLLNGGVLCNIPG